MPTIRFNSLNSLVRHTASVLLLCSPFAINCLAGQQQPKDPQDEDTRQIKLSEFTNSRPSGSGSSKPAGGNTASWNAPTYHKVKPRPRARAKSSTVKNTPVTETVSNKSTGTKATSPQPTEMREIGVTVWKLRAAAAGDNGPGFSVLKDGKLVTMTPERVAGTAPVALGDRVRISIESPRTGYLYVIDREQYADGSTGNPSLIFPTTRVRGGDNSVVAGRLVDIPDTNDSQPFFTLTSHQKAGEPEIVGELLTVVITDQPMKNITADRSPIPIPASEFSKWEDAWGGNEIEMMELNGGEGKAWTIQEKQAGEASRALTQEDPTPQTIYKITSKRGDPLMLTVQLLYGSTNAGS